MGTAQNWKLRTSDAKARHQAHKNKRQRERIEAALECLGNKCLRCGVALRYGNGTRFEFHHVKQPKAFGIVACADSVSLERFADELAKCVLLCASCHRTLTNYERNRHETERRTEGNAGDVEYAPGV